MSDKTPEHPICFVCKTPIKDHTPTQAVDCALIICKRGVL